MSEVGSAPSPLAGVSQPISRALFRLAFPLLASHALRLAYQWVDALWVRGLGVDATAAVTNSVFVMWSMYSLNDIFAIGVVAYVSQLLGAGDRPRAGVASFLALRGSLLVGAICIILGLFFSRDIFGLMATGASTLETGASYLSIVLIGCPFYLIALTSESIMRASGDSKTPFYIDLGAIALNIILDPILIYGLGPIEGMGVRGAALATVIAQLVMAVSFVILAIRGHRALHIRRHAPGEPVRTAGMFRVGVPAAMIGLLFSVVYITFASAAGRFGAASLAVVGIVNRLEAVQYLGAVAIGLAAAALVGQNLGAGKPERAAQVIKTGVRWVTVYTVILTVLMAAFPKFFLSFFTADPEVLALGVPYLRIIVLCYVINGIEIVIAEAILGSGHTKEVSIIFGVFSLARLPLAFIVPAWWDLGVLGIAWVITITCIIRGLVIIAWAARGTWKTGLQTTLKAGPESTS